MRVKRPTYNQRKIIQANDLDPNVWFVKKVYSDGLLVKNIQTTEEKRIYDVDK